MVTSITSMFTIEQSRRHLLMGWVWLPFRRQRHGAFGSISLFHILSSYFPIFLHFLFLQNWVKWTKAPNGVFCGDHLKASKHIFKTSFKVKEKLLRFLAWLLHRFLLCWHSRDLVVNLKYVRFARYNYVIILIGILITLTGVVTLVVSLTALSVSDLNTFFFFV